MYYVYILKSIAFNKIYIGYTDNLATRIKKHNTGSVRSTKAYRPYKLVYSEGYEDKKAARKRELFLKSGQGRKWIKENMK
ncbi:GIY-YIG nuclease family protein [Candidatus Margulisiibacteriota bacterium]